MTTGTRPGAYVLGACLLAMIAGCETPGGVSTMGSGGISTTALKPGECGPNRCLLEITVTGTDCKTAKIVDETLDLRGKGSKVVVWRIALGTNFEFCAPDGDGVYLQALQRDQFSDLKSAEDDDGNWSTSPSKCSRFFRVYNWNDKRDPFNYQYFVQFREKGNPTNVCKIDPWIKNGK